MGRRMNTVLDVLSRMDEREREIVVSYYGLAPDVDSVTMAEIGRELRPPISRERVRQLHDRALGKLAAALEPGHAERLLSNAGSWWDTYQRRRRLLQELAAA